MSQDRFLLKRIPAVDALLQDPEIRNLRERLSHATVVGLIRDVLAETRCGLLAGELGSDALEGGAIVERVIQEARRLFSVPLRKVINATGILIHTNLGRAPLSTGAQQAVAGVLGGYCNLEMDLETGRRTSRLERVKGLLVRITGAESAMAVNNNAAAVLLSLHVLAPGKEVIVSRGELVEIGGSFRLPDVMEASGAILREVGTTNRTRSEDYRRAISERTAMILKIHASNYLITGYTEGVEVCELAALAHEHGLLMMKDLGSGALEQHPVAYLKGEPRIQETLRAGSDLVSFSADKLLGGPQAGLLLGRGDLIDRLRGHPLARVLRLDKLHLAALEATLIEYLSGDEGLGRLPLYRLMRRDSGELRRLGEDLISALSGKLPPTWSIELVETEAAAGGGSLPGQTIPSVGVALQAEGRSMEELARLLRRGKPAIVGRLVGGRLILDLRSILEEEWGLFADLLLERLQVFEAGASAGGR